MTTITRQSGVVVPRVLQILGTIYGSLAEMIAQYIENGRDANASKIWVVLDKDEIVVTDNGHGMLPDMLGDDRQLLDLYLEDLSDPDKRKRQSNFDIRQELSRPSLSSLVFMVEYAAFSPKLQEAGSRIRGAKGIGAIAFRQFGDEAVWTTRPNSELATAFWGEEAVKKPVPTIELRAPTNEQLGWGDTTNTIEYPVSPLKDPYGNELESGTTITICSLKEGVIEGLKPSVIVDYLSGRFGSDIRLGELQLIIIDKVSSSRPIETMVKPPTYEGVLLIKTTGYLRGGHHPYEIVIYFNPKEKNHYPELHRFGSKVPGNITNIEQLNCFPWNSGQLGGWIEFPPISDTEAPWDGEKKKPLHSPTFKKWLETVEKIGNEVISRIEEINERSRIQRTEQISLMVEQSVTQAIRNIDAFRDFSVVTPYSKRDRKPSKAKSRKHEDLRTFVSVHNENYHPVPGVVIELVKSGAVIESKMTGLTGTIAYGILDEGRYSVRIASIPPGTTIDGDKQETFNIGPNLRKVHVHFRLFTGEPKPEEKKKIPAITIRRHDLDDPGVAYDITRMHLGIVTINSAGYEYRAALDSRDEAKQIRLECLYVASAITEYYLKGDISYVLAHANRLFEMTYSNVLESQESSKRGRKRKQRL